MPTPPAASATPQPAPPWRLGRWVIPGGERTVVAFVFLVACALRLAYLHELSAAPFFDDPVGDSQIYYQRALRILGGDWLGDGIYFHSSPPYPYLLALVMGAGGSFLAIGVAQALVGSANCVLVYLLAKRLGAGARAPAVLAGLMAASYGLLVFMDGELLMMFLTVALVDAALLLLLRAREAPGWGWPALAGLALGLAALDKTNVLLFVPVAAGWLAGEGAPAWRSWRWRPALAFSAAVALTVLPVTVRNVLVGRDLVLVSSNAGVNLFIGNNPEANGVFHLPPGSGLLNTDLEASAARVAEAARGRPLKPSAVSAYWSERAWRFVREQPGAVLEQTAWKLLLLLNAREVPNHLDFYLVRAYFAPVLRVVFAGYWLVVPLALLGLGWRARRGLGRAGKLYAGFLAAYTLSLLPFFISERYRLPLVPVLIPFAAEALLGLVAMVRARAVRPLLALGAGLAAAALVVNWPVAERFDFDSFFREVIATKYLEHAVKAPATHGPELGQAILWLKESLEENPGSAVAHLNLGTAYRAAGFTSGAIQEWRQTLLLDPRSQAAPPALQSALAAFAAEGDLVRREALPATPFERAQALLAQGRNAEAAQLLEEVIQDEPFNDGAYAELGAVQDRSGDPRLAARTLEAGLRRHPDSLLLLDRLGLTELELRRFADARRLWERCFQLAPGSDLVRQRLALLPATN